MKTEITQHERDELVDLAARFEEAVAAEGAADRERSEAEDRSRGARNARADAEAALWSRLRAVTGAEDFDPTPALVIGRHGFVAGPAAQGGHVRRLALVI